MGCYSSKGKEAHIDNEDEKAFPPDRVDSNELCIGDPEASFDAVLRPILLGDDCTACDIHHALLIYDNPGRLDDFYTAGENLGSGSFGSVHKSVVKSTKSARAVKSISKSLGKHCSVSMFRQEITIMKTMDHPNVIKLFETFEDSTDIHLVMELCCGGDLHRRFKDVGQFTEAQVATIMEQLFRAVYFLHRNRVVHRDIKPANFMFLTSESIERSLLKLIDFGVSCYLAPGRLLTSRMGTTLYSSPQVLSGRYDTACDLWSCGVVMFFIICGRHPFDGRSDDEVSNAVRKGNFSFGSDPAPDQAKTLVRELLRFKPQQRCNAEQALEHAFIRSMVPGKPSRSFRPSLIAEFRTFCSYNRLKRAALHVIAQRLEADQIRPLREIFTTLDTRKDGVLTGDEFEGGLSHALECVGNGKITAAEMDEHLPDLQQLVKELGDSGSSAIGYTEFLAATLDAKHFKQESACISAFCVFDRTSKGHISREDLAAVLGGASDSEILGIMREVDQNCDNVIDFQEFQRMMRGSSEQQFPTKGSTIWQVQFESWKDCPPWQQDILHAAKSAKRSHVEFECRGTVYEVDLVKMVRRSQKTGGERAVRERTMRTIWQVQFANWTNVPDNVQRALNTARLAKQSRAYFEINGVNYEADLEAMVQWNLSSGYTRSLRLV